MASTERLIRARMLINGELVDSSDKKTFPLFNPTTREKIADVPEATEDDVNAAVAAAKAAFPAWSGLDPSARGEFMKNLAKLLRENHAELARLEAISMGRPVAGYFDAHMAAKHFDHYAEAWPLIHGQSSVHTPGLVTFTLRQPFGPVGVIVPWNLPVYFMSAKSASALAAGNTVVAKSSEKAPLAVSRLCELIREAGFPPGVFNILTGHGNISGSAISLHMDIRALSFTGSQRTGRLIQEASAKSNLKRVILELGGKSPALIFADANMAKAAKETAYSIQWNSGQVCMADSRIYVEKSAAGPFVEAFNKAFAAVKPGDPTKPEVNLGPLADEIQYRSVKVFVDEAKALASTTNGDGGDGMKLALGGAGTLEETGGFFFQPTVFLDAPEDARITKEEVFGPVVIINTFETEAEAIAKANDSEYGLYASVYTRDISRAMRVAKALESGYVAVNTTSPASFSYLPFGGYKGSGQGREGWLNSLDNWTETKSVVIKVDDA